MKILLITAPAFAETGRNTSTAPPMGLLYLASYARKHGYEHTKIVDTDADKITWAKLEEIFKKENPDIVGITGTSWVFPMIIKAAGLAKKVLPGKKVIVGGKAATIEPEKMLRESKDAIDFVVEGEGEYTFLELIKKIEAGEKDFKNIKGIAYLNNEKKFTETAPRENIKNLDEVPWPAYDLLGKDPTAYKGMPKDFGGMTRPVSVILTTRGCPHRCMFCTLGSKIYRERGIKDVVDEIECHKNKFGAKSIQFYDDELMGMSPKQNERVEALCDEIIRRDLHKELSFLAQTRCSEYISLKTLQKMKEAGFVWLWWGVESGSQKILDFITKDTKLENIKRAFRLAKEAGINRLSFIMIGFPTETKEDIQKTVQLIKEIKPDRVAIHIVSAYPGSKLKKYLEDHSLLDNNDYFRLNSRNNVNHHTEEMTAEEIKKYYKMLVFRFETGYWYFLKFFISSLFTPDGWKKLPRRISTAINYSFSWLKLK